MTEYRVLVCQHVFDATRPTLLVAREDGEWIFACGAFHSDSERFHVVGVNHLYERDGSLQSLPPLLEGYEAERAAIDQPWTVTPITDA